MLESLGSAFRAALHAVDPELGELARLRIATLLGGRTGVPFDPERPTVFDFDEEGHPAIGGERFVPALGLVRPQGPGRAERL